MSLVKLIDPQAIVDYTHNWDDGYLDAVSSPRETISTSTWTIDPAPSSPALATELSVNSSQNTTTTATAFFTGGTPGVVYRAINHIVTSAAREDDRTITIVVGHR